MEKASWVVQLHCAGKPAFSSLKKVLRPALFALIFATANVANAAFSIKVQTESRAETQVDSKPTVVVLDPVRASSATQGDDASSDQPYDRRRSASALATSSEVARTVDSVSIALTAKALAIGDHVQTCNSCEAQRCIGTEGLGTRSSAKATALASVLVNFDEITLPGRYRFGLTSNISGPATATVLEVLNMAGQELPAEPDGSYLIQVNPGTSFQILAKTKVEANDKDDCGISHQNADSRFDLTVSRMAEMHPSQVPFILGGKFAPSYPQVGLLTLKSNGTIEPHCTGTLIGKRTVLTAAHCVAGDYAPAIDNGAMMFVLGSSIDEPSAERFTVTNAAIPSSEQFFYRLVKSSSGDITTVDDVAIIYLNKASKVDPLQIYRGKSPTLQMIMETKEPMPFVGFGFYSVEPSGTVGSGAGKRREAFVSITSLEKRTFGYSLNASGQGVCRGDSGGPTLLETSPKGWLVLGVTAYGANDCTSGHSMRVDAFTNWIDTLVKN